MYSNDPSDYCNFGLDEQIIVNAIGETFLTRMIVPLKSIDAARLKVAFP